MSLEVEVPMSVPCSSGEPGIFEAFFSVFFLWPRAVMLPNQTRMYPVRMLSIADLPHTPKKKKSLLCLFDQHGEKKGTTMQYRVSRTVFPEGPHSSPSDRCKHWS